MSVTNSMSLTQTVFDLPRHLFLSQTVCACHRQSVSFQDICLCQRQSVFVTDSLCLSQKVSLCQSVSLSNTFLGHPWTVFYLFIHDFYQDLSLRLQLDWDYNPNNPNLVDPGLP